MPPTARSVMPIRRRSRSSACPTAIRSCSGRATSSIDPSEFAAVVEACTRGAVDHYDARLRRVDGSEVPVTLSARPLEYDDANCVVIGALDLTEKQAAAGRDRAPARDHLSSREARRARLAARRRGARAQQPAVDRRRPGDAPRGSRHRPADRDPRRADQDAPPSAARGSSRPSSRWRASGRRQRGAVDINLSVEAALELLGYGLRSAGVEVHAEPRPESPDHLGRSGPDQPGADQPRRQRPAGDGRMVWTAAADGRHPLRCRDDQVVARPSPTAAPACRRRSGRGSSSRSSPPSRSASAPASGFRSATASSTSHGGTIEVRDAPGGGAEFIVRLPIGAEEQTASAPRKELSEAAHGGRVLIIDDEPEVAEALADILVSEKYRIDVAATGPEAHGAAGRRRLRGDPQRHPHAGHGRDGTLPPAQRLDAGHGQAPGLRHRGRAQSRGHSSSSTTRAVRTSKSRSSRSRCERWWRPSPASAAVRRGGEAVCPSPCRPIETIETKDPRP